MYCLCLTDGTIIGTTTKDILNYLKKEFRNEVGSVIFIEDLDRAIEFVDWVEE